MVGLADQPDRGFHFAQIAHHRQHDLQIFEPDARPHHGANLGGEDLRVVEGDADAAPAEERVRLLDGKVRQRLVPADVEGAHGDGFWRAGVELLAVDFGLLLLAGKALGEEEGHFGAEQPDAFGALVERAQHIGHQAGVHLQRHPVAVGGFAGQIPQAGEIPVQFLLLADRGAELLKQVAGRVGDHLALVAIDDELLAVELVKGQINRAHDRGRAHGARENRDMGIARALHGDQPPQLVFGHFREHRGGQLLADENGVLGILGLVGLFLLQMGQHPGAEVLDVHRALAQVFVLHALEGAQMLAGNPGQRALGPVPHADAGDDFVAEGVVVENPHIGVEQLPLLLRELAGKALVELAHFPAYGVQAGIEEVDFGLDILDHPVRHPAQVGMRVDHHRGADGDPGASRNPGEGGVENPVAGRAHAFDGAGGFGMGDNAGELRRKRDEKSLLALVEAAQVAVLDDEHAEHRAVVDDGDAEKSVEVLFAGLLEQAEVAVPRRVAQVDGFGVFRHQTHEALAEFEADPADSLLVQAFGRHQHVAMEILVEQINRADMGVQGIADPVDDDVQRGLQVLGRADFLDDAAQSFEHG